MTERWTMPKAIWSACDDDDFGRVVKLLFFTGCRRNEIGALSWSEINLDAGVMTIPGDRTKSGRELQLVLPAQAIEVLRQCPRKAGRDFLFGLKGNALSTWGYSKLLLDRRLSEAGYKLKPWTLHDIRRTVRTRLGTLRIKPHIAELVIGHSAHKTGVGAVYDRHDYADEIADALAVWANALTAMVEPPPAQSNVTPIRRATG